MWKNLITDKSGVVLTPQLTGLLPDPLQGKNYISGNYLVQEWTVQPAISLTNQRISINGLNQSALAVVVRVTFADGRTVTRLLTAGRPSFTIAGNAPSYPVYSYLWLGIHHIFTGLDHLLFVLGLLLLVRSRRSLFTTVTAFTVAHSITLAMAALNWVQVPPAPVEAIIALSIIFLALEIVRHYQGIHRLTYQYPWIVAFVFGLLHGFGFAGALAEVGLPPKALALSLLLFNLGVELGQLAFVAVILFAGWLLRKQFSSLPAVLRKVPPYVIGSLAAGWFIERVLTLLKG